MQHSFQSILTLKVLSFIDILLFMHSCIFFLGPFIKYLVEADTALDIGKHKSMNNIWVFLSRRLQRIGDRGGAETGEQVQDQSCNIAVI